MKAFILAMILTMVLAACGTTPVIEKPQLVDVAVTTKCTPKTNVTEVTSHPADSMKTTMSLYEKNQLLISENYVLDGQNKELKAALAECTK